MSSSFLVWLDRVAKRKVKGRVLFTCRGWIIVLVINWSFAIDEVQYLFFTLAQRVFPIWFITKAESHLGTL